VIESFIPKTSSDCATNDSRRYCEASHSKMGKGREGRAVFVSGIARIDEHGDEKEDSFLFDVDKTLLDNDQVTAGLRDHLEREVGHECHEGLLVYLRRIASRSWARRLPRRPAATVRSTGCIQQGG
jgi:hypothetical protein